MPLPAQSFLVAIAVALAAAGTASAQETAPATPPAAAPAVPAPGQPGQPGQPVNGDPAKPEVLEVVRDTFGAWEVRCAPSGVDCFMYQLAKDSAGNPVAEVSVLKLPEVAEATAGVTVVTPLGTLLPAGLALAVDGGAPERHPYAWCSQVGCFSRFGLDDPSIAALKRGKGAKLSVASVGAPDRAVVLDLSLSGFTAAYDSLETPANPTPTAAPAPAAPAPAAPPTIPAPLAPKP